MFLTVYQQEMQQIVLNQKNRFIQYCIYMQLYFNVETIGVDMEVINVSTHVYGFLLLFFFLRFFGT